MELLASCWLLFAAASQTVDIGETDRMRAAMAAQTIYVQIQPADREAFHEKVRQLADLLIGHPERVDALAEGVGPMCLKLGGLTK